MTIADVEAADGSGDKPLYSTCNGKVVSHIIPSKKHKFFELLTQ